MRVPQSEQQQGERFVWSGQLEEATDPAEPPSESVRQEKEPPSGGTKEPEAEQPVTKSPEEEGGWGFPGGTALTLNQVDSTAVRLHRCPT